MFDKYHQSERGFKAMGHQFDRVDYWRSIRSGTEDFIKSDPVLREFLVSLPGHKLIFTNARCV
jgi:hypothetical protein